MKDSLLLKIFTVSCQLPVTECDSVRLSIADSSKGEFSGCYGIKKGHARAVFSLKEGKLLAYKGEKIIFSAETSDGFAMVENDEVSVTVDSIKII